MLHPVGLCHHRGSQEFNLLHPMLHHFVPKMDCASSAANQDTWPETSLITRINGLFVPLATKMAVATTAPNYNIGSAAHVRGHAYNIDVEEV